MDSSTLNSLVQTYQAGQQAAAQLIQRAREVFHIIQRFNLTAQSDIQRIRRYRSNYLLEHGIDALPSNPIFAGPEWDDTEVAIEGITIVSREYQGNNEYDYHRFTLPFATLCQSPEEIEATLRASLTAYLKEVDDHEARQAQAEEERARQEYEALKARFEQA